MISLRLAAHCGVSDYACLHIPRHIDIEGGNGSLDTGMDHLAGNKYQLIRSFHFPCILQRNFTISN